MPRRAPALTQLAVVRAEPLRVNTEGPGPAQDASGHPTAKATWKEKDKGLAEAAMASVALSGPAALTGGHRRPARPRRGTGLGTSTAEGLARGCRDRARGAEPLCPGMKGFAGKKHKAAEFEFVETEGSSDTSLLCRDPGGVTRSPSETNAAQTQLRAALVACCVD